MLWAQLILKESFVDGIHSQFSEKKTTEISTTTKNLNEILMENP